MTAGLLCIGDAGNVQIDENYRNVALVDRGAFVIQVGAGQEITFTTPVNVQFIAWRCPGWLKIKQAELNANGAITWHFTWPTWGNPSGQTLEWFGYGQTVGSSENYGLMVWDAAGNPVFSSGFNYWNSAGVIEAGVTDNNVVHTVEMGRPIAVTQLGPMLYVEFYGGSGAQVTDAWVRVIGTRVEYLWYAGWGGSGFPDNWNFSYGNSWVRLLVADLSRVP